MDALCLLCCCTAQNGSHAKSTGGLPRETIEGLQHCTGHTSTVSGPGEPLILS